jgi:hypothetical protein
MIFIDLVSPFGGSIFYNKKKKGDSVSEARDRKIKRERKFEMMKAEKVLRACRSRRGYELFQEPEKKVKEGASGNKKKSPSQSQGT